MEIGMGRRISALALTLLIIMGCVVTAFGAEVDSDRMRLNTPDSSGNTAFAVENMFPGDAHTKDFTVTVNHQKPVTLYYHADIRPGSEKLAEVMMVKIELPEKSVTLYEGLMRDMPNSLALDLAAEEKKVLYRITAYLETSVGNDYQFQSLIADFRWWYTEGGEPASVKLVGEKVLDRKYPRGSKFTFLLKDQTGKELQRMNNRDGLVEFVTLNFDKAGTYTYTIVEEAGNDRNIRYDDTVYTAIVTVTAGETACIATVTYEKDGEPYQLLPRFVNRSKNTDSSGTPDNPKTADAGNLDVYLPVLAMSGLGLILLLLPGRRKKEERNG